MQREALWQLPLQLQGYDKAAATRKRSHSTPAAFVLSDYDAEAVDHEGTAPREASSMSCRAEPFSLPIHHLGTVNSSRQHRRDVCLIFPA